MQLALALINHQIENDFIPQRATDGFINATAMCKAVGKKFNDYTRIGPTQEFLKELSAVTGLPVTDGLIFSYQGGRPEYQGTWVHPDVAINLGQWCSPKFAVAVSQWVREWMSGNFTTKLPYHLERYMANRAAIPIDQWSMLNEMTFNLIAPLEQAGYHLPEELVPDISEGRMFCKWLRDVKGIDTKKLNSYRHIYQDGRIVDANLYPLSVLHDFRLHFFNVWLPEKAVGYFHVRDPKALKYLAQLSQLPQNASVDDTTAAKLFGKIKSQIAAIQAPAKKLPDSK
jgi:hypothetical protein